MDLNIYFFEKVQSYKRQLELLHKKYQILFQSYVVRKNKNKRLSLFIQKKEELFELMEKLNHENPSAFSYVINDYLAYVDKLNYKINREVLKNGTRCNVL